MGHYRLREGECELVERDAQAQAGIPPLGRLGNEAPESPLAVLASLERAGGLGLSWSVWTLNV